MEKEVGQCSTTSVKAFDYGARLAAKTGWGKSGATSNLCHFRYLDYFLLTFLFNQS